MVFFFFPIHQSIVNGQDFRKFVVGISLWVRGVCDSKFTKPLGTSTPGCGRVRDRRKCLQVFPDPLADRAGLVPQNAMRTFLGFSFHFEFVSTILFAASTASMQRNTLARQFPPKSSSFGPRSCSRAAFWFHPLVISASAIATASGEQGAGANDAPHLFSLK